MDKFQKYRGVTIGNVIVYGDSVISVDNKVYVLSNRLEAIEVLPISIGKFTPIRPKLEQAQYNYYPFMIAPCEFKIAGIDYLFDALGVGEISEIEKYFTKFTNTLVGKKEFDETSICGYTFEIDLSHYYFFKRKTA